jgi:hypothetical protein
MMRKYIPSDSNRVSRRRRQDIVINPGIEEENVLARDPDNSSLTSVEAEHFILGNGQIQTAQRQELASQIGRTRGNSYLQRALGLANPAGLGQLGTFRIVQKQDDETDGSGGNPVAPPTPGTSIHPTVRQGSTGAAVEELQEKLNQAGVADPPLVLDGIFGPLTQAATVEFQKQNGLDPDGVAGIATWAKMDELGLSSHVGRVARSWSEQVGGVTYSMTSRFTWRITDDAIRVTVKLRFTGVKQPALIASLFDAIRDTWNVFAAVNSDTGESLDIIFEPLAVESGEDNVVRFRPGNDRSDTENWYIGDPEINETAEHEFGHMLGLEDEYQRTHRDYKRLTGEEPPAGETENEAAPADVAQQLHDALRENPPATSIADSKNVITSNHLKQGDYAQQVAVAYQAAYGVEIVNDIVAHIPDKDQWSIVDPFSYSSGSIMGMGTNHEHPVEPRHVRDFVGYVQALKGGTWTAQPK